MNHARAAELFTYNPEDGVLRWRVAAGRFGRIKAGTPAGSINGQRYREVKADGAVHQAHRLAWMVFYGEQPPAMIDHANMDTADNRISNLRAATKSQNGANRAALSNNKCGIKGIHWVPSVGKWRASIRVNKKLKHLGYFLDPLAASSAYAAAASANFNEYART